jgi:hypothetical protein
MRNLRAALVSAHRDVNEAYELRRQLVLVGVTV